MEERKRIEQREEDYLPTLPNEILAEIGSYLPPKDQSSLSSACARFHALFQPDLDQLALLHLLRAVVDDKKEIVKKMLETKPELLLGKPRNLIIESQYTWQTFRGEEALKMALKRRQIDMVNLLLSYFEKLENGKEEVLRQWDEIEAVINGQGEHLDDLMQPITTISKETFPNGSEEDRLIDRISEETKEALFAFRKTILPDEAITLDNYLDVEKLLLAAYKAYGAQFNTFQNWNQRDLFSIGVIGFLQSVQNPELAKVFCEGLYEVVENKRQISARAESLRLQDNKTPFYRSSRDSHSGLGSDWLIDGFASFVSVDVGLAQVAAAVEKLYLAKMDEFGELKTRIKSEHRPRRDSKRQRRSAPLKHQYLKTS